MKPVAYRIAVVDDQLRRFTGLATDPQAREPVNRLLDFRLALMFERDRGFRMTDRRRLSGPI